MATATAAPTGTPTGPHRAFTIDTAQDDPGMNRAKALYLGPAKSGKSTLLATWNDCTSIEGQPGLFVIIAADENRGAIEAARPKIPYVVVQDRAMLEQQVLPWIMAGGLAAEFPSVEAVGFDSFSFYAKALELEANDWQLFASRASSTIAQFTRLTNPKAGFPKTYHLIVTCHEKDRYTTRQTAQGQRERHLVGTEPAVAGQMAAMLPGYFDLILYTERTTKAVEVENGRFEQAAVFTCRASEPPGHKAPAGGTLWGRSVTGFVDGSYLGLRALCTPPTPAPTAPMAVNPVPPTK